MSSGCEEHRTGGLGCFKLPACNTQLSPWVLTWWKLKGEEGGGGAGWSRLGQERQTQTCDSVLFFGSNVSKWLSNNGPVSPAVSLGRKSHTSRKIESRV